MSQYFPKAYELFGGDINVKVDLSNYATKAELKSATGVDTSKSAAKSGLASLKTEIDKLDVDKLNASGFVLKTKYNTNKSDFQKKNQLCR